MQGSNYLKKIFIVSMIMVSVQAAPVTCEDTKIQAEGYNIKNKLPTPRA